MEFETDILLILKKLSAKIILHFQPPIIIIALYVCFLISFAGCNFIARKIDRLGQDNTRCLEMGQEISEISGCMGNLFRKIWWKLLGINFYDSHGVYILDFPLVSYCAL
jgi:hypothetical protein